MAMVDPKPKKSALETADHLADALDENTKALDRVRRRYRVAMITLALVIVSLFGLVKVNHDGNVSRCGSGNELRSELNYKFQSLDDVLERAGVGKNSPEGKELLQILSDDIDLRDCSDITLLGK